MRQNCAARAAADAGADDEKEASYDGKTGDRRSGWRDTGVLPVQVRRVFKRRMPHNVQSLGEHDSWNGHRRTVVGRGLTEARKENGCVKNVIIMAD